MKEAIKSAPRFDEEVAGTPVEAHGRLVIPYARARGMAGVQEAATVSARYGWAVIQPVRMTVQDRSGEVREVKLVDGQGIVLAALAVIGLVVFLVSMFARPRKFSMK